MRQAQGQHFYTAPEPAIRALMQGGDEPVKKTSAQESSTTWQRSAEPINPERGNGIIA